MSSSNAPARRDSALDVAKGLAIIVVVFVHVWRGADAAGLIADHVLFRVVDTVMCLWVLTLFAFTTGLFIERGMLRDGTGRYARRRLLEFAWLYVLWSLLNNFSNLVGSQFANTPVTLAESLMLWEPRAQMWYLGWIGLMVGLAALAQPWRSQARAATTLALTAVGSAACWGLNGPYLGTFGLGISIAFFVGVAVGADRARRVLSGTPSWVHAIVAVALMGAICGLVVFGLATPPTHDGIHRTATTVALGLTASAMGTVAVLQLAKVLSLTPFRRPLAHLGTVSMVVFLAHLLFTPTTRIVLSRLGVTDPTVHVVLGTVAGVVGPLLLAALAARARADWLFALPTGRPAASPAGERRIALTRG